MQRELRFLAKRQYWAKMSESSLENSMESSLQSYLESITARVGRASQRSKGKSQKSKHPKLLRT